MFHVTVQKSKQPFEQTTASTEEMFEHVSANQASAESDNITQYTTSVILEPTKMNMGVPNTTYLHDQRGVISQTVYKSFKVAVWLGIAPIVTLIGIIGNTAGLWFMLCSSLRNPFHLFLSALMAADLLYLIVLCLSNSLKILQDYNKPVADYLSCHSAKHLRSIQSLTYSTCAHLISLMAFERLVTIASPMKFQSFRLRKCTIILIVTIIILNIILLFPAFLSQEPQDTIDPKTNLTVCKFVPTKLLKENRSFFKYYIVFMLVVARFIPGVITSIANILIAIFLTRHRSVRGALFATKATSSDHLEQFKSTMTLIILSVFLLSSLIPSALASILNRYYPHIYGKEGNQYFTYLFVLDLGYLLRMISAANDFFIYVMLANSSRRLFKELLMSKCCRGHEAKADTSDLSLPCRVTISDIVGSSENNGLVRRFVD